VGTASLRIPWSLARKARHRNILAAGTRTSSRLHYFLLEATAPRFIHGPSLRCWLTGGWCVSHRTPLRDHLPCHPPHSPRAFGARCAAMSSQPPTQAQLNLAALAGSPSPRTMRGLRKIQSHHNLSSGPPLSQISSARSSAGPDELSKPTQLDSPVRLRTHRRARSNSDASSREAPAIPTVRRPGRKTGSGFGVKRSLLETLLRDGPQQGNVQEALQELRYLVLSTRVEADGDGMVSTLFIQEPFISYYR
jgi:hypothetical protein